MAGVVVRCEICGRDEVRPVDLDDLVADRMPPIEAQPDICRCGGTLSHTAPIRCRACRSVNVRSDVCGIAD